MIPIRQQGVLVLSRLHNRFLCACARDYSDERAVGKVTN